MDNRRRCYTCVPSLKRPELTPNSAGSCSPGSRRYIKKNQNHQHQYDHLRQEQEFTSWQSLRWVDDVDLREEIPHSSFKNNSSNNHSGTAVYNIKNVHFETETEEQPDDQLEEMASAIEKRRRFSTKQQSLPTHLQRPEPLMNQHNLVSLSEDPDSDDADVVFHHNSPTGNSDTRTQQQVLKEHNNFVLDICLFLWHGFCNSKRDRRGWEVFSLLASID